MMATPKKQYPEGGWGWVVVIAACFAEFVVFGSLKAFGVLITAMENDFDTGLWIIGSINSLHLGVQFILIPLAALVARKVGGRPVICFGGFLFGLGVALSSVTHHIAALAVTIIAVAGFGGGCILDIFRAEFALYFHEKYDLAIFISLLGPPIGFFFYGPVAQLLLDTYGWRGAMLILGGFNFHLICAGLLVKRPAGVYASVPSEYLTTEDLTTDENEDQAPTETEDQTREKTEMKISKASKQRGNQTKGRNLGRIDGQNSMKRDGRNWTQSKNQVQGQMEDEISQQTADLSSKRNQDQKRSVRGCDPVKSRHSFVSALGLEIFLNCDFMLLAGIRMFCSISFGGVIVYMVPNGLSVGLTDHQASFLSVAFGLGSIVGPALTVFVKIRKLAPCQVSAVVGATVGAIGLALDPFVSSFAGQMVNTVFIATGLTAHIQAVSVLTRYLPFADEKFVVVVGWLGFLSGVATAVGDTLSGLIYGVTQSFNGTFFFYSASLVISGLLLLLDFCRNRYRETSKEGQSLNDL